VSERPAGACSGRVARPARAGGRRRPHATRAGKSAFSLRCSASTGAAPRRSRPHRRPAVAGRFSCNAGA